MGQRILTHEESEALFNQLKLKYGQEINMVNAMIHQDILKYGKISKETQKAQTELTNKILDENSTND